MLYNPFLSSPGFTNPRSEKPMYSFIIPVLKLVHMKINLSDGRNCITNHHVTKHDEVLLLFTGWLLYLHLLWITRLIKYTISIWVVTNSHFTKWAISTLVNTSCMCKTHREQEQVITKPSSLSACSSFTVWKLFACRALKFSIRPWEADSELHWAGANSKMFEIFLCT